MLIQRYIFAVLGAVPYLSAVAFGDDELVVLDGVIGREVNFEMPTPIEVSRCNVTSNTGIEFSLYPDGSEWPPGIDRNFMDTFLRTCGMRIQSATRGHAGLWIIRAFTESDDVEVETVKRFQLRLTNAEGQVRPPAQNAKRVDVFPSRTISIFPGNLMTLRMLNYYENLSSCIATCPDGQKFDVLSTVTNSSSDIRPFYQCGVTVQVSNNHAGTWRLDATIGNEDNDKLEYFGNFQVLVQSPSAINNEPTVKHVQRGAPASFRVGPSNAISCQLRNPSGQNLPIQSGSCQIDIPMVTNVHEGIWTASYSLNGRVNLVDQITEIVAYDDHPLNATVTKRNNGEVDLLCGLRAYSFSFCRFIKPNGVVLNVFEGIGNDRYLYYGGGTQSTSMLTRRDHECGITILEPQSSDYGTWKCILGTDSGVTGSLLRVRDPGLSGYEDVVASNVHETVYAVKGSSFTISCSANAVLKYCWMGSPNGTAYSVSSAGISPTTLQYEGMGLSLGECGAVVPAADDTDHGEWNCGMGVSNGQEVRSIVRVIVTDTLLMPNVKNLTVRDDRAELSCSLIPGHEQSIGYCRWIKPSGTGIERWLNPSNNEWHYITYNTNYSCHLEIENFEELWETGEWTCVAGLVGSSVEVSATIRVFEAARPFYSSTRLSSWCFGIGLAIISIPIAAFFIMMFRTKMQQFREKPNLPPRYEANKTGFPPALPSYPQPSFRYSRN